jgi:putative intracellular protease/amidase
MNIYLYVLDTLADYEISFLTAEIYSGRFLRNNIEKPNIIKVGADFSEIKTMGGMSIIPDIDIKNLNIKNNDLLVLPGADTWQNNQEIINFVHENISKDITIAAICGATAALAQKGILNDRKHTSNDREYLKMVCPNYFGENNYINEPVVVDKNLITASGLAPIEFTYEIIKKLEIMEKNKVEAWFNLYKIREAKYFYELMK